MRGKLHYSLIRPADVSETEDGLEFSAALPGIEADDLVLEMLDGTLTVRARHRHEPDPGANPSRGVFVRRVPLPEGVTPDAVKACFDGGVLTVQIPKQRRIEEQRIALQICA